MWTLDEAVELVRDIWDECAAAGWHLAITGGVLYRGESDKDLDLVAYPHNSEDADIDDLYDCLCLLGWRLRSQAQTTATYWRKSGSTDCKHVEVWRTVDGRRVDVIAPSLRVDI